MTLKVAILDRHTMFLQALTHYIEDKLFDLKIVSKSNEVSQLLKSLPNKSIDIIIMDLNISERDGLEMIQDIKENYTKTKIIILSAYQNPSFVRRVMVSGADAFLYKGNDLKELNLAVYELSKGRSYLGEGVRVSPEQGTADKPIAIKSNGHNFSMRQGLTKREAEVLAHISEGKNSKTIAAELYISYQTVIVHKKNIMKKLGVRNTTSLIKIATEQELV